MGPWPTDFRGTGAYTRVLHRMREELAGLVREVWMDKDDDVILPTDLGGQGKRCKRRLVLMHLPWETARGTEELQWRVATKSTVNQKMHGLLKAFFHHHFGCDFFAKALISQGESLLRPDRLAEWDAVLKRHRGSTQAVHAAGAEAEPAAAAHPSREPPIAIGHSGGDSAERRQQKQQLQLMRGELQARNVLEPLAQEVFDGATNNWWCHHGSRAGRGAQCEKCQLYNCLECQGHPGVCRNVGQCNQRSTGRGKG